MPAQIFWPTHSAEIQIYFHEKCQYSELLTPSVLHAFNYKVDGTPDGKIQTLKNQYWSLQI